MIVYLIVFIFGIIIGSFLNVCILRIPRKENIAIEPSHCMSCGERLRWYELIPLFSYLALGGRCRHCKTHISVQYPIIEALNGVFYLSIVMINGFNVDSLLYCLLTSALITLSVIDWRTYEIPLGINLFILTLGLIETFIHWEDLMDHLIGLFAVSIFLELIVLFTKGRGMGGGDVRLMAVCGLFLGWKEIVLALFIGCIVGSVIHLIRMLAFGADRRLAFGPYLAVGVFISMMWGQELITWYMSFFAV